MKIVLIAAPSNCRNTKGSYLRSFFGLSFVPPEEMEDFFVEEFTVFKPSDNATIKLFSDYVYDNYICSLSAKDVS